MAHNIKMINYAIKVFLVLFLVSKSYALPKPLSKQELFEKSSIIVKQIFFR